MGKAKSKAEILGDGAAEGFRKVRLLKPRELRKEFCKLIHEVSYSRHVWDVFADFVEFAALATHQIPYLSGDLKSSEASARIEGEYRERMQRLRNPDKEIKRYSHLMGIMTAALSTEVHDFLGGAFEELGLSNSKAGQFFTPFPVCRFMAAISAGDVKVTLDKKVAEGKPPIVTVQDPACGAGGMLIAFALEVLQQGVDPRANIFFSAVDIDRRCFNMAYSQLGLLSLIADVHWGNTLSMEMWEHRETPQRALFNDWAAPALRANAMLKLIKEIEALEQEKVQKVDFSNKRKVGKWEAISDSINDAADSVRETLEAHTQAAKDGVARADLPPIQLSILDELDADAS